MADNPVYHDWSKVSILPLTAKSDPDPGSTLVWLLDPDPDPHWRKLLDPDPHWGELLNESGSSLRWIAGSCSWSGPVLRSTRIRNTGSNRSGSMTKHAGLGSGFDLPRVNVLPRARDLSRSRIHECTNYLRFLGIILRVLGIQVSVGFCMDFLNYREGEVVFYQVFLLST